MQDPVTPEQTFVDITPTEIISRHVAAWPGLRAEFIDATARAPFEHRFKDDRHHLLIAATRAEREHGETELEGLPTSTLRRFSGRMTFVPAGHEFYGWQDPRVLAQVSYFRIDPRGPLFAPELRLDEIEFQPRLFFADPALWRIADRLKQAALAGGASAQGEALAGLLGQELSRFNGVAPAQQGPARGGLSGWQKRKLTDYIEAHLAEDVSLSAMASLVNLSPFHFSRVFKQSFGVPPHRYHVGRRMARAKALLAEQSVTEVALAVGFAETSSFSAAFRKNMGQAPSEYRRAIR